MVKQRIWFKKRTTRGSGRKVSGKVQLNGKNLNREIHKNQRVYSYLFLKAVLFMLIGSVWFRLGAPIGPIEVVPIGLALGLILALFERLRIGRRIELVILVVASTISYLSPVGIVL